MEISRYVRTYVYADTSHTHARTHTHTHAHTHMHTHIHTDTHTHTQTCRCEILHWLYIDCISILDRNFKGILFYFYLKRYVFMNMHIKQLFNNSSTFDICKVFFVLQLALHVLSFLEPKDLLVAALTCRYWNVLCEDSLWVFIIHLPFCIHCKLVILW